MGKGGPQKVEETSYQKELARVAADQWNDYQNTFVPIENEYMTRAKEMGDESVFTGVAGDVTKSYGQAYDKAGRNVSEQMSAAGVNPASGKASSAQTNLIEDRLGKENQATSAAQHNATQRYTGNMQNVTAMGKGQQTQATAGLQDVAQASGQQAAQAAMNKANEVSIPAAALGVGASVAANNPDMVNNAYAGLKDYISPSTYSQMNKGTTGGFSPMGGSSSYGLGS